MIHLLPVKLQSVCHVRVAAMPPRKHGGSSSTGQRSGGTGSSSTHSGSGVEIHAKIERMTLAELKKGLKGFGVGTEGTVAELRDRLHLQHDKLHRRQKKTQKARESGTCCLTCSILPIPFR